LYLLLSNWRVVRRFNVSFIENFKGDLTENWEYMGDWSKVDNKTLCVKGSEVGGITKIGSLWENYDFEFETATGDLVLVYAVDSTNGSRDLAYQVLPAASTSFSGVTENYLDDTGHAGDRTYTWVRIDRDPVNTSEEMVLVAFDSTDPGGPAQEPHINAWVWNGTGFDNQVEISNYVSSTGLGPSETGDAHQAKYAADGSIAMVVGANGGTGDVNYRTWNGSAWSAVNSFDISGSGGSASGGGADLVWALLKADPDSDDMQFVGVDSSADLGTAYWDGSTWSVTTNIETAVNQAPARRAADFAWNPAGSEGILLWENDGGGSNLELMVCSPECDGSSSTVSALTVSHDLKLVPHCLFRAPRSSL